MSDDGEAFPLQLPRVEHIRSMTPDDELLDPPPYDAELAQRTPQTLDGASRAWGDPTLVAKLQAIEKTGPFTTMASILGMETRAARRALPYTHVIDELRIGLIAKLQAGQLHGTGFISGAAPDAPRVAILPERWHSLTANFEDSSAQGSGIILSGIVVSPPKERSSEPLLVAVRLTVIAASRSIILDGQRLQLPDRPFRLMELLAQTAASTGAIVSGRAIEAHLWSTDVGKKACADAIFDLRQRLRIVLGEGSDARQLIANRQPASYILNLTADQIQIEK